MFQIETGAADTVINEQTFNRLPKVKLQHAKELRLGPQKSQLNGQGKYNAQVANGSAMF